MSDSTIHHRPVRSAAGGSPSAIDLSDGGHRRRILYIYPATLGPSSDPAKNPLNHLSRHLEGDFLAEWTVSSRMQAQVRRERIQQASGRFAFHYIRTRRRPRILHRLIQFGFYVTKGITLTIRHGKYDAVVAYGPFTTGLAGLLVGRLTRTPVIIEFPGHPFKSFELYKGWFNRAKRAIAPYWTDLVARMADRVRLLYPWQLDDLPTDLSGKTSTFHNFTTVTSQSTGTRPPDLSPYILFVGYPFHLKGVDILIRAFRRVEPNHPGLRLIIVGHCPDPSAYVALAGDSPNIEIRKPVSQSEVLDLMAGCEVFVLPSRIEAMGRVLLEARAAGRPVIASAVGGVPYHVKHEVTGLLFESENVEDLARQLSRLLDNPHYAQRLAMQGHEYVVTHLSEEQYAKKFREMVDLTLADSGTMHGASSGRSLYGDVVRD